METKMDRRGFLERAAGVAAGVAAVGASARVDGAAAVAAPVQPSVARIGLQLYSVRERVDADVLKALEDVAAVGYKFVEFAGYGKAAPEQIRARLDALKMKAPSTHIGLRLLRENFDAQAHIAEVLGHEYITVPSLDRDMPLTTDGWKKMSDEFNAIGTKLKARKIGLAFHSHRDEYLNVGNGKKGLDVFIASTDPALVAFEMDLGWAVAAGQDPLAWFNRYPGRFKMWHVKDMLPVATLREGQEWRFRELEAQAVAPPAPSAAPPAGGGQPAAGATRGTGAPPAVTFMPGPVPVGAGEIDFAPFIKQWRLAGNEYFFVEQDSGPTWPGGSLVAITTSYRNLTNILR